MFGKIALPTIVVNTRATPSEYYVVAHASLNSGSTNSFVTEDLVRQLQLKGTKQTLALALTSLDRQDRQVQTGGVNLEIAAIDNSAFVMLDNVYTGGDIPIKEVNMGTAHDISKCIPIANSTNVMFMIGQDNPREVRRSVPRLDHC